MRTLRLRSVTALLATLSLPAVAHAAAKDWLGANLTIAANTTMDGLQSNINVLTINPGVTVTVTAGLSIEFRAVDMSVAGTINANGAGNAGGAPGANGQLIGGGGNGGAGPGAGTKATNGASGSGSGGGGGGGGGYGGKGGNGGTGYSTCNGDRPAGGGGGPVYGAQATPVIEMGSGGGGGGGHYFNGSCTTGLNGAQLRSGATGGRGGGQVTLIATGNLTLSGAILADGQAGGLGGTAGCGGAGSGGGGSGGGVLINGAVVRFTGSMSAQGGPGGATVCAGVGCGSPSSTTCNAVSAGQAGGGGRLKIFAVAIPQNTGTQNVAGATAGTTSLVLTGPIGSLIPTTTNFGNQRVATTSAAQTVTVKNAGNGTLTVKSFTFGGANPGDFAKVSPAVPWSIPAMTSQTFTATFTPTAMGNRAATLALATNDPVTPTLTETLVGVGILPVAAVAPNAIKFGDQLINTQSGGQAVTITNTGNDVLKVNALALAGNNPGDFILGGVPALPFTVAAGAKVVFAVVFKPPALGGRSAVINIASDGGNAAVTLDGVGVAPKMSVTPAQAFGPQRIATTSTAAITIANQGSAPLQVNTIVLAGAAAADYKLVGAPALPATVQANAQVSFNVTFTPSQIGMRPATVTIGGSDPLNPSATVVLAGVGTQQEIAISPNNINFGSRRVNTTSAAQAVTITNKGTDILKLISITLAGQNAGDFALANLPMLPVVLQPNGAAVFGVTFTPTAVGARSASAVVTSDDPNQPISTTSLLGTGIQPAIGVTPTQIDFGNRRVGTTSMPSSVSIANNGTDALKVASILLGGPNAGDFALLNLPALPVTVPPGGATVFSVTFTPLAVGMRAGTVTLQSDDPVKPQVVVDLVGNGIQPAITVIPLKIDFGDQRVAQTSGAQTITVTNSGTDTLKLAGISLMGQNPGDFTLVNLPMLPGTLAPKAMASFSVSFTPAASGARAAAVAIVSDDPNQPTASVVLVGNGIQPVISVAPPKVDFGSLRVGKTSAPRTVTITNTGNDALKVTAISLLGANAADFALANLPMLPSTIAPNANATFEVSFSPLAVGARSGVVVVQSDDPNQSSVTVKLTGEGTQPGISLSPVKVTFPNQRVGTTSAPQAVTLSNIGTDPLNVANIALMGANGQDFALANLPVFPAAIAPNQNITFDVTFRPTAIGDRTAAAVITSDDPNQPMASVSLVGTGIAPEIGLNPMAIDFGPVPIGMSPQKTLVIGNNGSDSLTIMAINLAGAMAFSLPNPPMTPLTVDAGLSISITLQYTPKAVGADSGKLTLVTDLPNNPNVDVLVSGSGISGALSIAPMQIDFGGVTVGSISPPKDATITNTGNAAFNITGAMLVGGDAMAFALPNPPAYPATLNPGESAAIHVTYNPNAHSPQASTLQITTDLPMGVGANVAVVGTGLQGGIGASPASIDFGSVVVNATGGPVTVTLRNTGDAPLTLAKPEITGMGAAAYKVEFTPPAAPLAAGESTTLKVSFVPPSVGTFPAVLHVASANNGVPPVDVPLTGLGIAGDLSLTSLELDFKTVAIGATGGPLTVTLRNPGATPITLAGITSDAIDFVVVASPQLTATLQPGESMTFSVTFKPSSVGPQRASIAIDTAVRKGAAVVVAIGAGQASVAGGGCNCAIAPSSPDALGSLALGLLALLLSRRRRRT